MTDVDLLLVLKFLHDDHTDDDTKAMMKNNDGEWTNSYTIFSLTL